MKTETPKGAGKITLDSLAQDYEGPNPKEISNYLKDGDYLTAFCAIENIAGSFNKAPLYAGLAIEMSNHFFSKGRGSMYSPMALSLAEQLVQYAMDKSGYFGSGKKSGAELSRKYGGQKGLEKQYKK